MWSDRLPPESRQALVDRLHEILPAPRRNFRSEAIALGWRQDPAEVAEAFWENGDLVWLDQPRSRLCADPLVRIWICDRSATLQGPGGTLQLQTSGFDLLEAAGAAWGGPANALLCGYLGYELGAQLEDVPLPPRRPEDLPDLYLALHDSWLEHCDGKWRFHGTDAWRPVRPESLLTQRTQARSDEALPVGAIFSTPTDKGFCEAVARTVERIHAGELFQVNLCRRLETALIESQVWPLYRRLRAISPAAHGALLGLRLPDGARGSVLSMSPELFLRVEGRQVRSCPIKGTRPRGGQPSEDRDLARALQQSEKDRAELAMIVDVTRNDLGRVCRAGSVAVLRHAELMTLPTVHHTVSEVAGVLRPECGPADLLRACFPPASITGAPKIRAMQIAAAEEGYRRGPAMGAIGWISMAGDLELSVAIRTAAAAQGRVAYLAGCGITAESAPAEELAESEAKAAAFRRALGNAPATAAARESTPW